MRHSMLGGRPRVSMEELVESTREADAPVEEVSAIELAVRPDVDAIEAESAVIAAGDEVLARETDVAELVGAADTLVALRDQVEDSLEENGLDRVGAAVLNVSMQRTLSRIGTEINTPSMESYGSASSRLQNTRLTLEAISDKLKEIWAAIKQALSRAWEAVKKFFSTIFDSVARTKAQAEKVKAALSEATGTPTVQTVTAKGAGNKLAVNGKVSPTWAQDVAGGLNEASGAVEQTDTVTNMFDQLAAKLKAGDGAGMGEVVSKYLGTISVTAKMFAGFGGRQASSAMKIPGVDTSKSDLVLSPILPGNAVFYIAKAKAAGSIAEVVAASKAGFYVMASNNGVSDDFKVLSNSDIASLADTTIACCNAMEQRKASMEKYAASGQALIAAGDQFANQGGEDAANQQLLQALPRLVDNAAGWPKQAVSYYMSIAGAAMSVATASLKAYRAAAPDTAALPAPTAA